MDKCTENKSNQSSFLIRNTLMRKIASSEDEDALFYDTTMLKILLGQETNENITLKLVYSQQTF